MLSLTECRFQEGLLGISSLYFDNFFKPLVSDRIQLKNNYVLEFLADQLTLF